MTDWKTPGSTQNLPPSIKSIIDSLEKLKQVSQAQIEVLLREQDRARQELKKHGQS